MRERRDPGRGTLGLLRSALDWWLVLVGFLALSAEGGHVDLSQSVPPAVHAGVSTEATAPRSAPASYVEDGIVFTASWPCALVPAPALHGVPTWWGECRDVQFFVFATSYRSTAAAGKALAVDAVSARRAGETVRTSAGAVVAVRPSGAVAFRRVGSRLVVVAVDGPPARASEHLVEAVRVSP